MIIGPASGGIDQRHADPDRKDPGAGDAILQGVLCHAGESYNLHDPQSLAAAADPERTRILQAAETLRGAGLPCPTVSVGATPTALSARTYQGITEVRAGVYMFFDLVQAGIGVCGMDDIALSVLATVIGHQRDKNWIITDAGWMALSSDRGTAGQAVDQYYGLVCDLEGRPYQDLVVLRANQEHGIIAARPGSSAHDTIAPHRRPGPHPAQPCLRHRRAA